MATYNAVNIKSGAVEPAKLVTPGSTEEIYRYTTPAGGLLLNDIVAGPIIPANCYLTNVRTDCDALGGSAAFSVGRLGATAAFISAATNNAVAGGSAAMNVAGGLGYTATTPTQVLITFTAAAPTTGTIRIMVSYTANP